MEIQSLVSPIGDYTQLSGEPLRNFLAQLLLPLRSDDSEFPVTNAETRYQAEHINLRLLAQSFPSVIFVMAGQELAALAPENKAGIEEDIPALLNFTRTQLVNEDNWETTKLFMRNLQLSAGLIQRNNAIGSMKLTEATEEMPMLFFTVAHSENEVEKYWNTMWEKDPDWAKGTAKDKTTDSLTIEDMLDHPDVFIAQLASLARGLVHKTELALEKGQPLFNNVANNFFRQIEDLYIEDEMDVPERIAMLEQFELLSLFIFHWSRFKESFFRYMGYGFKIRQGLDEDEELRELYIKAEQVAHQVATHMYDVEAEVHEIEPLPPVGGDANEQCDRF